MEGIESTKNSTVTPLGLATTYTGTYESTKHYSSVAVLIESDVISETDGVQLIWSNDQSTETARRYYTYQSPSGLVPDEGLIISSQIEGAWLKVRFVKSALENQTDFSLKTLLRYSAASPPMRRLKDALHDEDLAVPTITWVAATKGTENANNSSTDLLLAAGTFEGAAEDVTDYGSITVEVYASHASATNGLSIEFSQDNVDWEDAQTYSIAATTAYSLTFRPRAKWFRVVYTNGGTNQTTFKLQTIYRQGEVGALTTQQAIDRSDTLTTGGTAETLMAFNAKRDRWEAHNPNASGDAWISLVGTAAANGAGSMRLKPGGSAWGNEPNAISWVHATTSAKLTAWEVNK